MGSFRYPTTRLVPWPVALRIRFSSPLFDVGPIVTFLQRLPDGRSLVTPIGAEMLGYFRTGCRSCSDHLVERSRQELHVMHVGPARDERQRDATPVD